MDFPYGCNHLTQGCPNLGSRARCDSFGLLVRLFEHLMVVSNAFHEAAYGGFESNTLKMTEMARSETLNL